ncbi:MAG: CAP domain-containing protein [Actinomycetota bacterium]|nr:CAP domain-containing protein [Actinomycetota bacterium]
MRRRSRSLVAVLTTALVSLVGPQIIAAPAGAHERAASQVKASAPAASTESSPSRSVAAEQAFLERINDERASAGLDGLGSDPALVDVARSWSETMATSAGLAHNPNLRAQVSEATGWTRLAENVGVGSDMEGLHDAFMSSKGHRRNVLGDFGSVGVGVRMAGGEIWVTVVFVQAR